MSFRVFCPKLAEKWPLKWAQVNSKILHFCQITTPPNQVHKRVNTLTAIKSRFVRRLRANFRASLREPTRKSRSHSTKAVAIAHHNLYICTYERRKANPALQRATNRPWQIIWKFNLHTSFLVLCLFVGLFCIGNIEFHPHFVFDDELQRETQPKKLFLLKNVLK